MKECPLAEAVAESGRGGKPPSLPASNDRQQTRSETDSSTRRPIVPKSSPWTMRVLDAARNRARQHAEYWRRSAGRDLPPSFFYVPIHVDPDAFTMVLSQRRTDQFVSIEALAKAAPARTRIVAKEHRPMLARRPRSQRSTSRRFRHGRRPDSRLFRNPGGAIEPLRTGRHTHLVPLPLATMWTGF